MDSLNDDEIKALISLLDESEPEVYVPVMERICQMGPEVVSYLEKAWETCLNQVIQQRLETLISDIQYHAVYRELSVWLRNPVDLLYGAYLIARFQYPDLKYESVEQQISSLAEEVKKEIDKSFTDLEKVRILNHVFFEVHRFMPNFNNLYAPQNNYINQVIGSKYGNPVSLAIVYAEAGRRAGLPLAGVNLPKNYILAYTRPSSMPAGKDEILFYINPYGKGAVISRREIDYFLKQQNIILREEYYLPCSHPETLKRLIHNLINAYESTGQSEKIARLQKLLSLF